jgi:ABC-2 type transport system ATP-binding protein
MAEKNIAVKVQNLTKSFRIPLEASTGLKQKLINTLKGRKGYRTFTPLNDISFEIEEGDFFGIVGRNGSGKSTLLKTIAGIYAPNKGGVFVNGTLVPFIELGVGFNPELTGRENVFLNGALLGFSHDEMENMYDDIVDFAEIEEFMDERLKNYSSGMQVRLAFSIAIRAEGDVLLLDEVLAVGDEAFQRKCYDYFDKLKRNKKTVILVTHDMGSVERFCSKAMMLEDGHVKLIGKPHTVAAAYSKSNSEEIDRVAEQTPKEDLPFDVTLLNKSGKQTKRFTAHETVRIKFSWDYENITSVSATVYKQTGERIFWTGTYQDGVIMSGSEKDITFDFTANLSEGTYFIAASLWKKGLNGPFMTIDEGPEFIVLRDTDDTRWEGITKLDHAWKI